MTERQRQRKEPPLPGLEKAVQELAASRKTKPVVVKVGAVSVKIYRMNDAGRRWCVSWRDTPKGPRQRIMCKEFAVAKAKAEELCTSINNGRTDAGDLTEQERLELVAARRALTPLEVSVDAVAREVAEAHKLTNGAGILEMARFWSKHHASGTSPCTVAHAHDELLASKSDVTLNARYRRELTRDLKTFVTDFAEVPIHDVKSEQILKWLRERKVGWLRRNKLQSLIVTLFRYAKNARHLPQDGVTEPERLTPLAKPADTPPPGVFTVGEMRLILANVRPEYLPWAVLGAFAGVRQEEISRLKWDRHFHWEENVIEITQEVAKRTKKKNGDARIIEMPDNLVAWLKKCRKASGPVCDFRGDRETGRLAKILPDGKWPHNGLRHSWYSHTVALSGNLHTTAYTAGNSPQVGQNSYINPRMKRDAVAWFNIFPDTERPGNVVEMNTA